MARGFPAGCAVFESVGRNFDSHQSTIDSIGKLIQVQHSLVAFVHGHYGPESNFERCGDAVSRVWNQILQQYDQLRSLTPTADGALNRPAALAEVSGPAAALAVVETLDIDKPCVLSWACVEEPARRSK